LIGAKPSFSASAISDYCHKPRPASYTRTTDVSDRYDTHGRRGFIFEPWWFNYQPGGPHTNHHRLVTPYQASMASTLT
jgi:hypothetical protein